MISFSFLLATLGVMLFAQRAEAKIQNDLRGIRRSVPVWSRPTTPTDFTKAISLQEAGSKTGGEVGFVKRESTDKRVPVANFLGSLNSSSRKACPILIDQDKPASRISTSLSALSVHPSEEFLSPTLDIEADFSLRSVEISPRIVGGKFASPKLVRSMVAFYNPSFTRFICTGTLLSPKWALVAAHCRIKPGHLVSLGSTQAGRNGFLFSITRTYKHPKFKSKKKVVENDIAVVEILGGALPDSRFLEINDDRKVPVGKAPVRAVGFGTTSLNGDVLDEPKLFALRQVDMLVSPPAICNSIFKRLKLGVIEKMHICAGTLRGACGVCKGDSGGPLLRYKNGRPLIVGITSFGTGCGLPGIPNAFTRVSGYLKWLKSTPAVFYTEEGVFGDNTKKCRFGQFVFSVNKKVKFCRDCPFKQVSKGGSRTSCTKCPKGLVRSTKDGRKCTCMGRLARGRGWKNGFCKVCARGTFSGTNNKVCLLCQPGTFSSREGSSVCSPCDRNKFSDKRGATFCKRCPPGKVSSPASSRCR